MKKKLYFGGIILITVSILMVFSVLVADFKNSWQSDLDYLALQSFDRTVWAEQSSTESGARCRMTSDLKKILQQEEKSKQNFLELLGKPDQIAQSEWSLDMYYILGGCWESAISNSFLRVRVNSSTNQVDYFDFNFD